MPHTSYLWPIIRQVHDRSRRTEQMIDRLGVDAAALARRHNGESFADVQRICFDCRNSYLCRRWLESDRSENSEPEFCPNLKTFLACQRVDQLHNKGK